VSGYKVHEGFASLIKPRHFICLSISGLYFVLGWL